MTMQILSEETRDGHTVTIYWDAENDTTEVWIVPSLELLKEGESAFGFDAGENGALALDIAKHPFYYRQVWPSFEIADARPIGAFA